jgi:hypothetical protein
LTLLPGPLLVSFMITNPITYVRNFLATLKASALASLRTQHTLEALRREMFLANFSKTDRFQDPLRLFQGAFKVFSEATEDGMINEIFSRVGTDTRRFVEIGVADGLECNTAFLLTQGWTGAWIDCSATDLNKARHNFAGYPLSIVESKVTPKNVDSVVKHCANGLAVDLLSIDIDSYDYYIWEAVRCIRPRLVVIEYNSSLPPHICQTIEYAADITPTLGTIYFGASLGALVKLGATKDYSLVGCSITGVNAFFVRNDLLGNRFRPPFTAGNHYEPPRYGLIGRVGHGPGIGRWRSV